MQSRTQWNMCTTWSHHQVWCYFQQMHVRHICWWEQVVLPRHTAGCQISNYVFVNNFKMALHLQRPRCVAVACCIRWRRQAYVFTQSQISYCDGSKTVEYIACALRSLCLCKVMRATRWNCMKLYFINYAKQRNASPQCTRCKFKLMNVVISWIQI